MGKIKFTDIQGAVEAEAGAGGGNYSGPLPPAGAYTGIVKRLELVKNKNNNFMLKVLIELKAKPGTANSKYDGYGVWNNLNVTDQGKGYVNAFLDALTDGSSAKTKAIRKAFWEDGVTVEGKDGLGHVLRIGAKKVNSPNAELPIQFSGKRGEWKGEEKLEVARYLLAKNEEEEEPEEVDEEDLDETDEDVAEEDLF